MTTTPEVLEAIPLEVIPVEEPDTRHLEAAARLLEQALQAGRADPEVAYLLALAYKRQGKTAEARAAFRKIANPDGNVVLQLGLLSFAEKQFAQAEQEFARARQTIMETCENEQEYMLANTKSVQAISVQKTFDRINRIFPELT